MKKGYYAIIPANVRYDEELMANAKLLYGEITALCNEKGYCWATNNYFAELYGVSKGTISRWISDLVDKGYVRCEMIYKEGTNQIEKRKIYINDPISENDYRYNQKEVDPMSENEHTPIRKNDKDNNTIYNNTMNNTKNNSEGGLIPKEQLKEIITKWNELELAKIIKLSTSTERYKMLRQRIEEYDYTSVLVAIENIKYSSFLQGKNDREWTIAFDWLVRPNNFIKVLEGQYKDLDKPTILNKKDKQEDNISELELATNEDGEVLKF